MALELYYTSAPKGLKPGSTGFCTVAYTTGMPATMIQKLESLGGYRPVFPVGSPNRSKNPPIFAHWRVNIGAHFYSILSHVCFAGADYQGRFNKLAHHVVVNTSEQVPAGPAWVMMQPGVMEGKWTGEPQVLPVGKTVPDGPNPLRACQRWAELTGDAGWGGMLAQAFLLDASKPAYILFEPGMDVLPLLNEAIALLPEKVRWRVTFSTYFDSLPAGLTCSWRCCAIGTPGANSARSRATSGVLIDLTNPPGEAPANKYVMMARTGELREEPHRAVAVSVPGAKASPAQEEAFPSEYELVGGDDLAPPSALGRAAAQPTGSTAARRMAPPPRRRTLAWTVAIVWPLAVLAIGGLLVWHYARPKPPPVVPGPLQELRRELDENKKLVAEFQTQLAKVRTQTEEEKRGRETAERELREARADLERQGELKGELAKLKEENAMLKGQLASASTSGSPHANGRDPNTATGTRPVPTDDDRKVDGVYLATYVSPIGKFGAIQKNQWKLCAVPAGAAKVTLKLTIDEESLSPFSLSETDPESGKSDGRLYVVWKGKDNYGNAATAILGVGWVEDGALHWKWQRPRDVAQKDEDKPTLRRLEVAIHHGSIHVFDAANRELRQCQFIMPAKIRLALEDPPVRPQQVDCPWEVKPVVAAIDKGEHWVLKDGAGTDAVDAKKKNGLAFRLRLESKDDRTTANCLWAPESTPATIQGEIKQREARISDLSSKISALDGNAIPKAEKNLNDEKHRHQNQKKHLDQRERRLPEEIRKAEEAVRKREEDLGLPTARQKLAELEAKLPRDPKQRGNPRFRELREACDNARKEIAKREQDRDLMTKKENLRQFHDEQKNLPARRNENDDSLAGAQQRLKDLKGELGRRKGELANCQGEKKQWEGRKKDAETRQEIVLRLQTERSKILLGTVTVIINGGTERTRP